MNRRKLITMSACLMLTAALLSSCSKGSRNSDVSDTTETTQAVTEITQSEEPAVTEQDEKAENTSDLAKGIVMNIGGKDITEDEYRYYFFYAKEYIDEGDESYWDEDLNGQKLAFLKSQTESILLKNSTVYILAKENSVELDEEDIADINKTIEEDRIYYETVNSKKSSSPKSFDDYLKETHCTSDVFRESYIRKRLEEKIKETLFASESDTDNEDEIYDEDYEDEETEGTDNTEKEKTDYSAYDAEYEALCTKTQEKMKITFDTDYDSITIESLS